jgi:hypothetical protein
MSAAPARSLWDSPPEAATAPGRAADSENFQTLFKTAPVPRAMMSRR